MPDHRHRFLQLALRADALRFGQFTLKSGRLTVTVNGKTTVNNQELPGVSPTGAIGILGDVPMEFANLYVLDGGAPRRE